MGALWSSEWLALWAAQTYLFFDIIHLMLQENTEMEQNTAFQTQCTKDEEKNNEATSQETPKAVHWVQY